MEKVALVPLRFFLLEKIWKWASVSWIKRAAFNLPDSEFCHLEFLIDLSTRAHVLHQVVGFCAFPTQTSPSFMLQRPAQTAEGAASLEDCFSSLDPNEQRPKSQTEQTAHKQHTGRTKTVRKHTASSQRQKRRNVVFILLKRTSQKRL